MANVEHEHTLNVWLAELLRRRGLNARQERKQANRRRIDVEIHVGNVKIALEAEQGQGSTKKRDAIGDADGRLRQRNADCAIAVCYPDGITARSQLEHSRVLWAIRAPNRRAPVNEVRWPTLTSTNWYPLSSSLRCSWANPDHAAAALSASLDAAVERLSENQKREIARALDLPSGKLTRLPPSTPTPLIEHRRSRWNPGGQAGDARHCYGRDVSFRGWTITATSLNPTSTAGKPPGRASPPPWPPDLAQRCAKADDPIGAFDQAWDSWLAVDYKPIFATAESALNGCAHDHAFTEAVKETAAAALALPATSAACDTTCSAASFTPSWTLPVYDGSFYTTTPAATLLASLAINEDTCDWSDAEAVAKLRITDPACGTGTLLMAAAERVREFMQRSGNEQDAARALIEQVLSGYDITRRPPTWRRPRWVCVTDHAVPQHENLASLTRCGF